MNAALWGPEVILTGVENCVCSSWQLYQERCNALSWERSQVKPRFGFGILWRLRWRLWVGLSKTKTDKWTTMQQQRGECLPVHTVSASSSWRCVGWLVSRWRSCSPEPAVMSAESRLPPAVRELFTHAHSFPLVASWYISVSIIFWHNLLYCVSTLYRDTFRCFYMTHWFTWLQTTLPVYFSRDGNTHVYMQDFDQYQIWKLCHVVC